MFIPKGFAEYLQEWEAKINAFIELNTDRGDNADIPCAVDENIAVKGLSFTCCSPLLANVRSPYSATAVQKLEAAGSAVIGKTCIDEFGLGVRGYSVYKQAMNPWDSRRTPGSGAAAAVAAGIVPCALGNDAGGSLRQAAMFCGVTGLKPTHGAVSRYGLAAGACGLETIGVIADTVSRCRAAFAIIRGRDPLDQASKDPPDALPVYPPGVQRIGVIAEIEDCVPEIRRGLELAKERLAALGHTLVDITVPGLKYCLPAWYTIAAAQASSSLARYDSIRFGARPENAGNPDELYDKSRAAGLGMEAQLHILLGTHVLRAEFQERYYLTAHRIRAGIQASLEAQFEQCDAILMPVYPNCAFEIDSPVHRTAGVYACCANLTGLPALSFPVSVEGGLPVGVQLMGNAHSEGILLDIAEGYHQQHPPLRPRGFEPFWDQE